MNKLISILITLLCSISLCNAQNINQFWEDYSRLKRSGDYSGLIMLLNNYSKEFLNSNDYDRFAYYFLLSEAQSSLKQYEQAQHSFENSTLLLQNMTSQELEKIKENDFGRILLGRYYYFLGKKYFYAGRFQFAEESLHTCRNLLFATNNHERLPIFRDLHLLLAQLYLRLNNMPTALRNLNDAKLGSEVNLLFDDIYCRGLILSGVIYLNQDNYLKAKMYFDEAAYTLENNHVTSTDDNFFVNSMLGSCYLKMGYPNDAKKILTSGINECKNSG